MIGRIHGIIIEKQPPLLIVDISGIGYEVFAPMSTFYHLPNVTEPVTLLTHQIIREDGHFLYGFLRATERQLFRALIKVNGVGPKLALSILSSISLEEFVQCIHHQDTSRLIHIPGIGKKTAERLIIETRDAMNQLMHSLPASSSIVEQQCLQDALSALLALGYKSQEAEKVIKSINPLGRNSEEIIRLALQKMLSGSLL